MNELDEIIKRNEDGYTIAKYGNDENIYFQMAYDIEVLLDIIDNFTNKNEKLTIDSLLEDIYQVDHVTLIEMQSRSTSPRIATARRIFYYITSVKMRYNHIDAAKKLNKNNSSVSSSLKCWKDNDVQMGLEFNQYKDVIIKYNKI